MKKTLSVLAISSIIISCQPVEEAEQNELTLLEGFNSEKLFEPGSEEFGSWVSLAHVENDRFVASDQYGDIYWIDVPPIGENDETIVTPLPLEDFGKAQGLLWAYNSLYVVVNHWESERSGLYRLQDSNNDGNLDNVELLKQIVGEGEHGPHAVILGPDGLLYVIAGNHTEVPEEFSSRAPIVWEEDQLFEAMKDPNGHATQIKPPGGWIARTDGTGSFWEIYSSGYRNAYDIAFNEDGELFTFDSDMEWDLGLPWYRPIRVCHVTSGSEFGWRTGSGKWRDYYPDNLPGVFNIGQGSPTGVTSAQTASFPAPFNSGLFVCDWSYGTMYHVDLVPSGASYTADISEFLSGIPLPLTDVAIGSDGAMYFTTGGRRLESGLYRVWYDGDKETQKGGSTQIARDIQLRRSIEAYHGNAEEVDTDLIWNGLDHEDRFVRFASRIAIEKQGLESWSDREDASFNQVIEMSIASARVGAKKDQSHMFETLAAINPSDLSDEDKLRMLRAESLLIIRNPELSSSKLENQWKSEFPSEDIWLNEEITNLFSNSDNPMWFENAFVLWENTVEDKTIQLINSSVSERSERYGEAVENMRKRRPYAHKIALMNAMAHYKSGWDDEKREKFFFSFNQLWDREGGFSYRGFLLGIMDEALKGVDPKSQEYYRELSGANLGRYGNRVMEDLPTPEGPGKAWSIAEIESVMAREDIQPNYANGLKMFDAALCRSCHTFQGQGNNLGPDLTQIASRFSVTDLAVSLVVPNSAVSDQYKIEEFTLENGNTLSGKVFKDQDDTLHLILNPLRPDVIRKLPKSRLESRELSDKSIMFPALLNRLNEQEVVDLMTFMLAAGDESDDRYK